MRPAVLATIAAAAVFFEAVLSPPSSAQAPAASAPAPSPAAARPAPPPRPGERPVLGRLEVIRLRGELLVCAGADLMSLTWRNTRNGELEGLDTDMARAFAARLNVRPVFVETTTETMMPTLEAGRCDVAMGGVGVTPGRAARVAFTKPYLSGPMAAVTSRSSTRVRTWADMDRHGVAVAVAAGSVAEELVREQLRVAESVVIRAPQTQEQEVLAGRADVFLTDGPYARRLRDDDAWRVMDAPRNVAEILYAYAVPRGEAAWLAEVNAFLAGAKSDGTLSRVAARWGVTSLVMQ